MSKAEPCPSSEEFFLHLLHSQLPLPGSSTPSFFPTSNPGLRFSTLLGKNLSYKWPNHMSYDTLNVKKTPHFYSFSENPFQTLTPGLFHPSINVICSNKFSCSFCPLLSLSLYTALSILWHPWLFFLLKNFIFTFSYLCVCDSMCVTVVRVL